MRSRTTIEVAELATQSCQRMLEMIDRGEVQITQIEVDQTVEPDFGVVGVADLAPDEQFCLTIRYIKKRDGRWR
ncbi:MAG TPA: hypothetical protein VIG24_03810 [Acidimicrobiia bacterium]